MTDFDRIDTEIVRYRFNARQWIAFPARSR
jgi:hypothetical protein